jgi:CheY-like chemotaxis protein
LPYPSGCWRDCRALAAATSDAALVGLGRLLVDGLHVAHALRCRPGAGIRFIVLRGLCRPEDRWRAGEASFDTYLTKLADQDERHRWLARD